MCRVTNRDAWWVTFISWQIGHVVVGSLLEYSLMHAAQNKWAWEQDNSWASRQTLRHRAHKKRCAKCSSLKIRRSHPFVVVIKLLESINWAPWSIITCMVLSVLDRNAKIDILYFVAEPLSPLLRCFNWIFFDLTFEKWDRQIEWMHHSFWMLNGRFLL